MPKIKLTKSELKKQRDDLKQFSRFLPTLQLKKQQLQMEMLRCREEMRTITKKEEKLKQNISSWVQLFGEESVCDHLTEIVKMKSISTDRANIAGVDVPVFLKAEFDIKEYSLFETDAWLDDAVIIVQEIVSCKAEAYIIKKQYELISQELRVTTQRVNLFEKVKIPECKESVRVIQIYLGDQQTAAVGRSKMAKKKMQNAAENEVAV
jgi:V/A-type H+-transporting ATPase subunit D